MSQEPESGLVTQLLLRVSSGDREAEAELIPHIYAELRRLAAYFLNQERPGHTLQPTALVHEAYLKLVDQHEAWKGRGHFYGVAAQVMRRILADYGRKRRAAKRGGGGMVIPLDENMALSDEQCGLIVDLDDALERLTKLDPRQARIVELRFFGGMTEDEIAELLSISSRTVKRDWAVAKAWIYGELTA